MGYPGVEEVTYLSDQPELAAEEKPDMVFMNPQCSLDTADNMEECGRRKDAMDCNQEKDVYIRCLGECHAAQSVDKYTN